MCRHLEAFGYSACAFLMHGEQFGLPQTRTRAMLMASRVREVFPPAPTHQKYVPGQPARHVDGGMFNADLLPWVSMKEALDGAGVGLPDWVTEVSTGNKPEHTETGIVYHSRKVSSPSPTLTTGAGGMWNLKISDADHGTVRNETEPAGTLTTKGMESVWTHTKKHQGRLKKQSANQTTLQLGHWTERRPATTLTCDERLSAPGSERSHSRASMMDGAIKLTIEQAKVLQGFPIDMPVSGSRKAQFKQIGNSVPPTMALPILKQLTK